MLLARIVHHTACDSLTGSRGISHSPIDQRICVRNIWLTVGNELGGPTPGKPAARPDPDGTQSISIWSDVPEAGSMQVEGERPVLGIHSS